MRAGRRTPYDCRECEASFHELFDLIEHDNLHSGETPFMCLLCRETFSLLHQYVDHLKIRHKGKQRKARDPVCSLVAEKHIHTGKAYAGNGNKIMTRAGKVLIGGNEIGQGVEKGETNAKTLHCRLCEIRFSTSPQLSAHKEDVHPIKCPKCKKVFSTCEESINHSCIILCSCREIFTSPEAYKSHVGARPLTCCKCPMKFNTLTNLIRHNRTHTKQKPYVCNDCGRGFSQSAHLRNHATLHLSKFAVKCNQCDFSCKTSNGLLKHKKKHSGGFINIQNYVDGRKTSTGQYHCPVCNKKFLFKRNLGMHSRVHNISVLLCAECGKTFETPAKLSSHYKACHREPSVCKTCGKIFASAVLLRAHNKIHAGEKLHSCKLCRKSFRVKNYLTQHMKTHSGKKEFSCNRCGKVFKAHVSLKYHSNICTKA